MAGRNQFPALRRLAVAAYVLAVGELLVENLHGVPDIAALVHLVLAADQFDVHDGFAVAPGEGALGGKAFGLSYPLEVVVAALELHAAEVVGVLAGLLLQKDLVLSDVFVCHYAKYFCAAAGSSTFVSTI